MREHLPAFLRYLASRGSSPRTTKTYGAIVASFFAFLDSKPMQVGAVPGRADLDAFLARPRRDSGRRSAASRNQELAALRSLAKFGERELGWTLNPTEGIPFAREAPRDPAVLSVFEVRRLFTKAAEVAEPAERSRNLALLAVLAQAGLRVHEVVGLDLGQVDIASATLVAVHGKGGTVHDVPLNAPTLTLITAWLGDRVAVAKADEPALFVSSRGGRLSVRAVQRLLLRLRVAIGTAKKVTPHTLRHTTATLALTLGADLSTVADLLRHSDLNTTRRYLHLVDERRREAVRRLGTAIPAELLGREGGAAAPPTRAAASALSPAVDELPGNVRPFRSEGLDVQCGLDDIPTSTAMPEAWLTRGVFDMRPFTMHAPPTGAFRFTLAGLFATILITPGCEPIPPKAPEHVTVDYKLPKFTPVKEGSETQEKGGVVLQVAPPPFSAERSTKKTCQEQQTYVVSNNQYPYETREVPSYDVTPKHVEFKVKVVNHMDQVLKLEGTVFKLNVDGKEIALDQEGYKTFTGGILTPNEEKQFTIQGPEWTTLPDAANIGFSIYSLPVQIDKAGTITERGNFDWTYKFAAEKTSKDEEIAVGRELMTKAQAAEACR